jgi:hypothetical protein
LTKASIAIHESRIDGIRYKEISNKLEEGASAWAICFSAKTR